MSKEDIRKIIKKTLNEAFVSDTGSTGAIIYSAVIIEDPAEIEKIQKLAQEYIPTGWTVPEHYHMTIALGQLPSFQRNRGDLNKPVDLEITTFGISDTAAAFGTFGYYSRNEIPHITIAYNKNIGGVPADSKEIKNWQTIDKVVVTGIIRNVGENNAPITEMDIHSTFTTSSREAWPGANSFPNPSDYDEFGNNLDSISR